MNRITITLLAVGVILTNVAILKEFKKIEKEIAAICQGQCKFGDEECNRRCAERHLCPVKGE